MSRTASLAFCAAALAAGPPGWSPAHAQCRLCDTPTVQRDEPQATDRIQLEVETSLKFDRLISFGAGEGSVTIKPDGSSSASGAVAVAGPRAMVGTATVRGTPGRSVRIDLPPRIQLYSLGGGTIIFDEVTSDLPAMPRLDLAGRLSFRFGGRVTIRGDAEGDYRGDLPINVEYQ